MAIIKSPKERFSVSFVFWERLLWWKERKSIMTGSGFPALGAPCMVISGPGFFENKLTRILKITVMVPTPGLERKSGWV